jgi:hypothetical protein
MDTRTRAWEQPRISLPVSLSLSSQFRIILDLFSGQSILIGRATMPSQVHTRDIPAEHE